jgi:hypothetical protein
MVAESYCRQQRSAGFTPGGATGKLTNMDASDGTWTFIVDGRVYQLPRDPFFELCCAFFLLVPLQALVWRERRR